MRDPDGHLIEVRQLVGGHATDHVTPKAERTVTSCRVACVRRVCAGRRDRSCIVPTAQFIVDLSDLDHRRRVACLLTGGSEMG